MTDNENKGLNLLKQAYKKDKSLKVSPYWSSRVMACVKEEQISVKSFDFSSIFKEFALAASAFSILLFMICAANGSNNDFENISHEYKNPLGSFESEY